MCIWTGNFILFYVFVHVCCFLFYVKVGFYYVLFVFLYVCCFLFNIKVRFYYVLFVFVYVCCFLFYVFIVQCYMKRLNFSFVTCWSAFGLKLTQSFVVGVMVEFQSLVVFDGFDSPSAWQNKFISASIPHQCVYVENWLSKWYSE